MVHVGNQEHVVFVHISGLIDPTDHRMIIHVLWYYQADLLNADLSYLRKLSYPKIVSFCYLLNYFYYLYKSRLKESICWFYYISS